MTDPQTLADVDEVSDHEAIIELPEDVIKMWVRRYGEQE